MTQSLPLLAAGLAVFLSMSLQGCGSSGPNETTTTTTTAPPISYGLRFELFQGADASCGNDGCIRVAIDTMVAGNTWSLLLDTGSSTLALCNGTTDLDHHYIPPVKPVPEISDPANGMEAVLMYGGDGDTNCHGFAGFETKQQIGVGPVHADAGIVIMDRRHKGVVRKERGNSCGLPLPGSLNATRLEGIFGFGGAAGNGPYYNLSTCGKLTPDFADCTWTTTTSCSSKPHEPSGFADILLPAANVHMIYSITWPTGGMFGADSGTLRFGKDDNEGRIGMGAALYLTNTGSYGVNITGFDAYFTTEKGEQPVDSAAVSVYNSDPADFPIVDTGSPAIDLPEKTFDALDRHFMTSEEPVTVKITVDSAISGIITFELHTTKAQWNSGVIFDNGGLPGKSGWNGVLGLSLWKWYDKVEFDLYNKNFTFFKRPHSETLAVQERMLDVFRQNALLKKAMQELVVSPEPLVV